jgi:hypothetical protein
MIVLEMIVLLLETAKGASEITRHAWFFRNDQRFGH